MLPLIYTHRLRFSFLPNVLGLTFSLGFVVAGFVLILIEERSHNVKHLQLLCGMNKFIYWLTNILWDFLWYLGFVALTLAIFLAFQDPYYTTVEILPIFTITLLLYGLAVVPWVYVLSFLFQSAATAYIIIFCVNFMGALAILTVDLILYFLNFEWSDYLTPLYYLASIPIPAHNLARCLVYIGLDIPMNGQLYGYNPRLGEIPDPYKVLAPYFYSFVAQAALYTLILALIELWPYFRGIM